ncbi:MAG: DUF362 domain-containing protein [Armatimonadetes bacterium]|nr:DUF362 domain-containing protein [Armatimonadota bacterium]
MPPLDDLRRRDFLRGVAVAGAGLLGRRVLADDPRAKVVIVTCADSIKENDQADSGAVRRMMEKGICALAGVSDVEGAWKRFIRPGDRVALVDSGTWLNNVPEVVVEAMRGIRLASPQTASLTYCFHDDKKPDWMAQLRSGLQAASLPGEVLRGGVYTIPGKFHEQDFTTIVMTPTLKSHSICGVSGVIKHYATMSKQHVSVFHPNAMETCGMALGEEFNQHRHLVIVDALRFGKMTAGPQFYQKSLIFGTDPVATDVVALEVFLKNCTTGNQLPPDRHRTLAGTQYHAGISDRARIDLTELTV